jgi:mannonate dehydratase
MRIAIGQFSALSAEMLTFARQLGASGVLLNTPTLPGDRRWEYEDLLRLRLRCEEYGLRLEALEKGMICWVRGIDGEQSRHAG